ncbi:MAG: Holliday junction branch migration protein RuvA [Solobacterium sp.]|nr:Holliday junction branch migration protein RuvA [Solobacterium sp.]
MISFISGTVAAYGADYVIVENHGIGWQIAYAHPEDLSLNREIRIYTYMHITENDTSLYGFPSQEEKDLFLRLISVKGLGPKTAMNMLAKAGYAAIVTAIEEGNVAALKKMPGIGAKSAGQIVLDLKGKVVPVPGNTQKASVQYPPEIRDALEGLKNFGYKAGELNAVGNVLLEKPGLKTEEYIKIGLQYLLRKSGG